MRAVLTCERHGGHDAPRGKWKAALAPRSPSALGLVCGVVFMSAIILVHLYRTRDDTLMLANYNAALLSTCLMVLLGAYLTGLQCGDGPMLLCSCIRLL